MFIDVERWNTGLLARRWELARPFPHIVLDGTLSEPACTVITGALDEESAKRVTDELYEAVATDEPFVTEPLKQLAAELGADALLAAVRTITGKDVTRVKARGYAYNVGHYLLPHADRDADALRQIAFALYIYISPELKGGELELFECETQLGQITRTDPAGRIAPRPGRLILFDVSDVSLHQVCEVTEGTRASVSGWFY